MQNKYVVMWFTPVLVVFGIAGAIVLAYKEYRSRLDDEKAATGCFKKFLTVFMLIFAWIDMVTDVLLNQEMHQYIQAQKQTDCAVLGLKAPLMLPALHT